MDLDETMTTSSASTPSALQDDTYEEEGLFPGSATNETAHTPANDHLNAAAPGELSPPRSQTHSSEQEIPTGDEPATMPSSLPNGSSGSHTGANTRATRSSARLRAAGASNAGQRAASHRDETSSYTATAAANERDTRPGYAWKTKQAQDEMQRAWENVVDRDFSLKEYGDVVMQGKAQLAQ